MNSPVKSGAALRLRRSTDPTEYGPSAETEALAASHETARENLYRFPSIGIPPRRPSSPRAQTVEPSLARLDDLAVELEAALMNDLNKVAPLWGDEALALPPARPGQLRLPLAPAEAAAPASKDEVPHSDRLAVELLLARGRAATPVPALVAPRVEPRALEESLAGELAERLSAAVDELKIAEGGSVAPDLALAPPPPRRFAINRPLIAMAVATLLVAGGALLTIQSLTTNSDVPAAADMDASPTAASAPPEEGLPAVAAKRSYERAEQDVALSDAPQLRGADMMLSTALSPGAGSADGNAAAEPSVRAAYVMPGSTADIVPAAAAVTAEADGAVVPDAPAARAAVPTDEAPTSTASASEDAVSASSEPAPPVAAATPAEPAASISDLQPGAARITSGVRLRGNPDNNAPTVGYLKPGAEVKVVQCKGWCEVVVGDKRGFVFKRFLAAL